MLRSRRPPLPAVSFAALLVVAGLTGSGPANAAVPLDLDTARGAREVAMGGAFREVGIGANAADGNPAALAQFQAYQLELGGGWDPKSKSWFGAGWARDSTNPDLSGGYSLHYLSNDLPGGRQGQWAHSLGIATRLGDTVAIGIGGRWLMQSAQPKINAASLNAGLSIKASDKLTLGIAAYNLIETHHPELARAFEVGFGWLLGPLRLVADARSDLFRGSVHPTLNTGAELFLGRTYALRAGYEWREPTHQNFVTGGIGFVVDNAGFDFAYRHGLDDTTRLIVATLRLQLQ